MYGICTQTRAYILSHTPSHPFTPSLLHPHSFPPTPLTPSLPHTHPLPPHISPTLHLQTSQPGSLAPHNGGPCGLHGSLSSGLSGSQLSQGESGPSLHTRIQLQSARIENGLHHFLRQDHWEEVCVCQLSHLQHPTVMLYMFVAGVQLLHS